MNYIKSWLIIDVVSVLPINELVQYFDISSGQEGLKNLNSIARLSKVTRVYRLIKLTKYGFKLLKRLIRFTKVLKGTSSGFAGYILSKLHLDQNIEQLCYFFMAFAILNHLSACVWYYLAKMTDFESESWVTRLGYNDASEAEVLKNLKLDIYTIVLLESYNYYYCRVRRYNSRNNNRKDIYFNSYGYWCYFFLICNWYAHLHCCENRRKTRRSQSKNRDIGWYKTSI